MQQGVMDLHIGDQKFKEHAPKEFHEQQTRHKGDGQFEFVIPIQCVPEDILSGRTRRIPKMVESVCGPSR
jgi:hypothetical protein